METAGVEGSRILLVEDEESLAVGLEYNLSEEGYEVIRARDGREALERFETERTDLIILDLMLPYVDGFEVARQVRERSPRVPILMLTARTTAADRIRGLETGADDYLTKPFHLRELLLRVRGMLRRKLWYQKSLEPEPEPRYRFGDNEVDFSSLSCVARGKTVRLTPLEAGLLRYLVQHRGKVVSREELLENVWQTTGDIETRTVDNFIVRLRRYFEPDPSQPRYFKNVRGAGYEFRPD
jgi:two-component system alkaline phosphatase synthesis response regulator PhoP